MNNLIYRKFHFKINKKNTDDTKTIGNFGSENDKQADPYEIFEADHISFLLFFLFFVLEMCKPHSARGRPEGHKTA